MVIQDCVTLVQLAYHATCLLSLRGRLENTLTQLLCRKVVVNLIDNFVIVPVVRGVSSVVEIDVGVRVFVICLWV